MVGPVGPRRGHAGPLAQRLGGAQQPRRPLGQPGGARHGRRDLHGPGLVRRVLPLAREGECLQGEPRRPPQVALPAGHQREVEQDRHLRVVPPGRPGGAEVLLVQGRGPSVVAPQLGDEAEVVEEHRAVHWVAGGARGLTRLVVQPLRAVQVAPLERHAAEHDQRVGRLLGVPERPGGLQRPPARRGRRRKVPELGGDPRRPPQRPGPAGGGGVTGQGERLLQPGAPLAQAAEVAEDLPRRRGQAQAALGVAPRRQPGERRPQVAVLGLQPVGPGRLHRTPRPRRRGRPLRQLEEVRRVAVPDRLLLPARRQPLQPVLPHRLQHRVP